MFRFTANGTIGRIQELAKGAVRISVAADRIIEGAAKTWTQTEWLGCVTFDASLGKQIVGELQVGQSVTLEGRLVPRDRMVDGKKQYETMLELTGFKAGAKRKANGKSASASDDAGETATA